MGGGRWGLSWRSGRRCFRRLVELIRALAGEEPFDAEHVGGGAEGAVAEAVFADAGDAGSVIDGDFGEAVAGALDEGGDEAVHAAEEDEGVAAGSAHHLEGAAGVADAVAGEAAADQVGDAALEAFEGGVAALGAVAADEVEALVEQVEHGGEVAGVVLEVAVEEGDDGSGGGHDAGVHGGGLAAIFGELEDADEGMAGDVGDGGVGGAVVDEDEFEGGGGEGGDDFAH